MICHDMPWYAMICHDMPWYAMICHDMPWYAMICHDMPECSQMNMTVYDFNIPGILCRILSHLHSNHVLGGLNKCKQIANVESNMTIPPICLHHVHFVFHLAELKLIMDLYGLSFRGFQKWIKPPNDPKLDHFRIETYGFLEGFPICVAGIPRPKPSCSCCFRLKKRTGQSRWCRTHLITLYSIV